MCFLQNLFFAIVFIFVVLLTLGIIFFFGSTSRNNNNTMDRVVFENMPLRRTWQDRVREALEAIPDVHYILPGLLADGIESQFKSLDRSIGEMTIYIQGARLMLDEVSIYFIFAYFEFFSPPFLICAFFFCLARYAR